MEDSYIKYDQNGHAFSFVGPDAVELFRAATLRSSIGLLQCGITPTRGMNMKRVLAMAKRYTGRSYRRGEAAMAVADLNIWIAEMKAALPTQRGE